MDRTAITPAERDIAHALALEEDAARRVSPPDPRRAAREQYAADVADLFAFVAGHPDIPMPHVRDRSVGIYFFGETDERAGIAAAIRAFRRCKWDKRTWEREGDAYFEMTGTWEGWHVKLSAHRDAVCKRVVAGTEDREVEEIVTPAVTRKVVKPVEIIEWVCEPVTAPAGTDVAA
ncbi:MAG TPA: hypothetical protein VFB06_11095 [Streptosporangiaceae bacterium]|nr:hypothetical protein [Streptosporangiaceae bacterium]